MVERWELDGMKCLWLWLRSAVEKASQSWRLLGDRKKEDRFETEHNCRAVFVSGRQPVLAGGQCFELEDKC